MVALAPAATNTTPSPPRVEILGVFGAGKTTLGTRLATGELILLAECHEANPFWDNEAAAKRLGYLPYDLAFLLHHADLVVRSSNVDKCRVALCDWSFASDELWASMRLGDDSGVYREVHSLTVRRLGPPLGWLYLRQPPELIVDRLARRGRTPEERLAEHVISAVNSLDELARALPAERLALVDDGTTTEQLRSVMKYWSELTKRRESAADSE